MAPSIVAAGVHHGSPPALPLAASAPHNVPSHGALLTASTTSPSLTQPRTSCDLWTGSPPLGRPSSRVHAPVPSPSTSFGSTYTGSSTPSPLVGATMNMTAFSAKQTPDYYRAAAACTFSSLPGMMFTGKIFVVKLFVNIA